MVGQFSALAAVLVQVQARTSGSPQQALAQKQQALAQKQQALILQLLASTEVCIETHRLRYSEIRCTYGLTWEDR